MKSYMPFDCMGPPQRPEALHKSGWEEIRLLVEYVLL